MKNQNKLRNLSLTQSLRVIVMIAAISVLLTSAPVLAPPGVTYPGTTTVAFSVNPATLSGDAATDVTITTTTTAPGAGADLISEGRVRIQLATDGSEVAPPYVPVPAAAVTTWVALNAPGQNPDGSGQTTYTVDLDALGFVCGTVGGFRAQYVTGGGQNKVDTHFSDGVDLTTVCPCEWIGETAWANGPRYVEQGNWATYTPYVADSTVILYAGQTMEAGTVDFSAPVAGVVTITITLNEGWRFYDDPENVKIQDYASAPSGNPSPGLFDWKDYATESSFSIDVPENNFYGVHVDVEWELCE
ncbi:MAG: hypothetical protein ACYST5_03915 [Planctomycetota bacterium]